jgi:hypothetical protein
MGQYGGPVAVISGLLDTKDDIVRPLFGRDRKIPGARNLN